MFQPIVKGKARLRGHCGGTLYTALLVLSDPVGKSKAHSLYEIDIVSHVSSCDLLDVLVTAEWVFIVIDTGWGTLGQEE